MKNKIHIIGGGVIGLCSAWYLNQEGFDVTVVEKNSLENGTSHGNAGMIVPSHFIPMASPGVITKGLKWMFNAKSPFYIKPRMSVELLQWLWRFYWSCDESKVKKAMPILYQFNEWSKSLYEELSENHFSFNFEKKGLLMLYKTENQGKEEAEIAEKAHHMGIEVNQLSRDQIKSLEPNINVDALGGFHYPGDAHIHPNVFIKKMVNELRANGVKFLEENVIGFNKANNLISELIVEHGSKIGVENVIVASGSWTAKLLKELGIKLLLQDGKGYSYTFSDLTKKPQIPTILTEAKVAITPLGNELRVGGTLELGGMSNHINRMRLTGILESTAQYYPVLNLPTPSINKTWKGFRPCTPDGMPYIGKSSKIENLTVATGHGMMGMSLGPATGKLISEIMANKKTTIPTNLFDVDRF